MAIISPQKNTDHSSLVDDTGVRYRWDGVSGMGLRHPFIVGPLSDWLIIPAGQSGKAAITFFTRGAAKNLSKFSLAVEFLVMPKDRLLQDLESGKPSNISPITLSVVVHEIKPD